MLLAKSNPVETLAEHTMELMKRYDLLFKAYGELFDADVWELLRLAVMYHDTGKAYTYFQYTIKKALNLEVEKPHELIHIPHNYLSPFYLPLSILKMDKASRKILIQAIAYHHEREIVPDSHRILEMAKLDIPKQLEAIKEAFASFDMEFPEDDRYFPRIASHLDEQRIKSIAQDNKIYLTYVLVKGLLHRLDHAASAHVAIEVDTDFDFNDLTQKYLRKLTNKTVGYMRPLQQFAHEHQNKNLVLIAQTGMGKTEAALLWAGKKKTFFTVPLRVSLNALFDRVASEMGYAYCGLLHSTSAHYLDDSGREDWEVIYDQSKHFANKLIFTTIDQILKFPFKFRGYEKYYATLAHSCVIIDEIQAYSPWITAVIIKALEMIHKIGGRFMVMTATMPQIYLDALEERGLLDEQCAQHTFYDDTYLRHRIELHDESLDDELDAISRSAVEKKVLVIVNTIDRAVDFYERLKEILDDRVYLLHSRFIQKDRQLLEQSLKNFDRNPKATGVWITTQIVEASIDIDFDELYTELSPLDSLFQRFGRCYRKRPLNHQEANIHIFMKDPSGSGTIYDKEIMAISEKLLHEHINKFGPDVLESRKISMVAALYSKENLMGTDFYERFQKALMELDHMDDYRVSFSEAQQILRGDETIMVIPRKIYDELIPLFEALEMETDGRKRSQLRREIEKYTCSVSKHMFKNALHPIDHYRQTKSGKYPVMNYIYILEKDYEFYPDMIAGRGILKEESKFEEL